MNKKIKTEIAIGIILIIAIVAGGLIWLSGKQRFPAVNQNKKAQTLSVPIEDQERMQQENSAIKEKIYAVDELVNSNSEKTCINEPGKAFYPPNEKCCNGLKSIFGEDHDVLLCQQLNKYLLGAPVCAPCGNGKCEKKYGENRCSCPEDCK